MLTSGTNLMVPKGSLKDKAPLVMDFALIHKAEERIGEVSYVIPDKAQELMGFMNQAASDASRFLSQVQFELLNAKRNYDKRKAVLLLDEFDDYVKQKGIKPNEDIREAFLLKDTEISELRTRMDVLKATSFMLENKIKSFDKAYYATRMIADIKKQSASNRISSTGSLIDEDLGYNTFE